MADKPELRAFTVNQYGSGQNRSTRWTEIGAAWRTQKGHLRIQLEAVPVNGQLILLPPKEDGDTMTDDVVETESETETEPDTGKAAKAKAKASA
ncbi:MULTISPECIES: hypothetical protein [Hyphomonas]|uniref:Uncharacterized protein n=1 Tax=Hyphomonas adhaerens TaxID=81029 RepID=A0A3B9H375_9PROT|nr:MULTISPECIES: hypothetical protein [Hyphomonas]MBB38798.1 hypothetical protein [Hyphomonas sp.]HAE29155.1 hypothetical protein [Hyphomonas adhaerens]|tara:strand:- start:228 stop:509 length:282 start_codon:yes stop_codon:yes gene_type:complete